MEFLSKSKGIPYRGAMVEWLERLEYDAESRRKVVSLSLGSAIRRLELSLSLCQSSSKWVPFFESEKGKAAKGERWAPFSISCNQATVGL